VILKIKNGRIDNIRLTIEDRGMTTRRAFLRKLCGAAAVICGAGSLAPSRELSDEMKRGIERVARRDLQTITIGRHRPKGDGGLKGYKGVVKYDEPVILSDYHVGPLGYAVSRAAIVLPVLRDEPVVKMLFDGA
jgi:hypothetical protein